MNPNGSSTDTLFQYSTNPSLPANVVTTLAGTAGQFGSTVGLEVNDEPFAHHQHPLRFAPEPMK